MMLSESSQLMNFPPKQTEIIPKPKKKKKKKKPKLQV